MTPEPQPSRRRVTCAAGTYTLIIQEDDSPEGRLRFLGIIDMLLAPIETKPDLPRERTGGRE